MIAEGTTKEEDGSILHEGGLTDLEPNTTYHYGCGSEKDGWSLDHTFKTASVGEGDVSFMVMGDSRNNPTPWKKVADAAASEDFDFTLFSGDMVGDGSMLQEWKAFFDSAPKLLSNAPFMTVLGNHEFCSPLYFTLFAMPGNEAWIWSSVGIGKRKD